MEGAVRGYYILSSWMLPLLFMVLSLLCTVAPCAQERAPYSDQRSASEPGMNQPQQRAFEMAVCTYAWREERIRLSQASGSLQCALA